MNLLNKTRAIAIGWTLILLGAMVCLGTAVAQQASETQVGSPQQEASQDNLPNPTLKLSPAEMLRRFEPALGEEYTLGAGDEISIQCPARPELASKEVIGPDGRITLQLVGALIIANLTREEAAKKISNALSQYYTDVTATVQIDKYGSNHVTLLGDVKTPGTINFDQTPTLLEVLSKGGIETRPDGNLPEQCVIYRGDDVLWVDLQDLLTSGSPLADLRLRRNDVVFVPAISTRTITVMGQVQHPGEIPLRHNSTLTSILGEAGGVSDAAGSNPELQIVHRSKGGKTQYIRFKDLLKPGTGSEISLNAGDVLYVPKSGMAKVGFFTQQLAPFLSLGSFAALAAH